MRPARAGLSLDVDATVATAQARSWNPLHLLDALAGGDEVAPVVAVDRARLRAAVDRLAATVDRQTVEGSVRFGAAGAVKPVQPVDGLALRPGPAADALARATSGATCAVAARVVAPRRAEDRRRSRPPRCARAAEEVATPATAADVTLTVEGAPASSSRA